MNINELKNIYNNDKDEKIKKTIEDVDDTIKSRCKNGLDYVYRDSDDCYLKMESVYVEDWLIDVLKEHYERNGFEVEVQTVKITSMFNRITKREPKSYRKLYIRWNF